MYGRLWTAQHRPTSHPAFPIPPSTYQTCRLHGASAAEVQAAVAAVLSELGLLHVARSRVGGSSGIRGVSGGERRRCDAGAAPPSACHATALDPALPAAEESSSVRCTTSHDVYPPPPSPAHARVTIAMELVTEPSVLVLDEVGGKHGRAEGAKEGCGCKDVKGGDRRVAMARAMDLGRLAVPPDGCRGGHAPGCAHASVRGPFLRPSSRAACCSPPSTACQVGVPGG
jgi:hypothetical protein